MLSEAELRELLGVEDDDDLNDRIPVCKGEWRRENDGWRAYDHPDCAED